MRIPFVSRFTGKCLRSTPTKTLMRTHTRSVCPQQLGSSVWFEFKQESMNSEGCVTVEFLAASLSLSVFSWKQWWELALFTGVFSGATWTTDNTNVELNQNIYLRTQEKWIATTFIFRSSNEHIIAHPHICTCVCSLNLLCSSTFLYWHQSFFFF